MALILCVETSSKNCSVAISEDGVVKYIKEKCEESYCHGEQLHVLIEQLFFDAKISLSAIDSLAFSVGPGSYTGLRIGASAVKGLAVALDKEVVLVSTLQSMCWGLVNNSTNHNIDKFSYLCPTLDSRRGEVYAAVYDLNISEVVSPFACEVKKTSFSDILQTTKVCFFGPGLYKLQHIINNKNASFLEGIYPSSNYLGFLAEKQFNKKKFAEIAYFEPLYLKDFISH